MWTNKTGQFPVGELAALEGTTAEALVPMLTGSDPVVVLRALAEIMLNGDDAKLRVLLRNGAIRAKWHGYRGDHGVDGRDHEYARQLTARESQLKG